MHKGQPALFYDESDKDDLILATNMILELTKHGLGFKLERRGGDLIIILDGGF